MRIAVIDLGTNTFNLLIADIGAKGHGRIVSDRIPVKLGEGTINSGFISPGPFQRGLDALSRYRELIEKHDVDIIRAFATSAIRSASNGADFVQQAKDKYGIWVEIIDGDREAELIHKGVALAVELQQTPSLIMDIGGGSTEFIICNKQKVFWKKSFQLGAARLLEKFNPEDPISESTRAALRSYIEGSVKELSDAVAEYKPTELIGSSGAFDSFVEMIACEYNTEGLSDEKTEYQIDLNNYKKVSAQTVRSTLAERMQMKGLIPIRVDMIVLSFLFVDFILQQYAIKTFKVSTYSLKEGVIFETFSKLSNN
ncbi:MAG: Ppx/GppA phosphatase [Bacteroidetes bacterium]|jgi:exopolyphosphatase/guanosine-5'-triphosphate,3'-diphosphate pyrophosphatase|nr:Ppx/GppA phosphatase [Bacteroidota bacterium]